jgi:hypothetical protein
VSIPAGINVNKNILIKLFIDIASESIKKAWGQVFKFESKNAYIWPNSAVKRDVPPYGGFESLFFFMVRWLRSNSVSGTPLTSTLGNA